MEIRVLSSLCRVFLDQCPQGPGVGQPSVLQGEVFSFQVALRSESYLSNVGIRLEGDLASCSQVREVGLVSALFPGGKFQDGFTERTQPGLYPDPLQPLPPAWHLCANQWRSLWVTVSPEDMVGRQEIRVVLSHKSFEKDIVIPVSLEILPQKLPKQELICTMWFHVDGIAQCHRCPPYSEEGWALIDKYMAQAASHGINMLLVPVVTPPLDTQVGGQRLNVQLADITRQGERYAFGWEKLRRYVNLARKNGIAYLEICHLFTQWGALHAPNIYCWEDGVYKQLFGWDTDAAGAEYTAFLGQFVPSLTACLEELGMADKTWFHVSDEPHKEQMEQYMRVSKILKALIPGYPVMDALSDFDFYATGAVAHPIPASNRIGPFLEAGVPDLWTYYCVSQWDQVSNRFFSMPSQRNRILGLQLWKFRIHGFLHWGFNFYNTALSLAPIDPWAVTDAGGALPSGDPFVVYPWQDGCTPSLRLEVFREAMQDLRACCLAEKLHGRERVLAELEAGIEPITFQSYPRDAQWLLDVRRRINCLIAQG